jgi:Na+-driven multidrug efflux pump
MILFVGIAVVIALWISFLTLYGYLERKHRIELQNERDSQLTKAEAVMQSLPGTRSGNGQIIPLRR